MAATRHDVIGFRRIFVLFSTLVLLPALLLAGFGVIAIANERHAQKQRRHEEAQLALRVGEHRLVDVLGKADRALRDPLERDPKRRPDEAIDSAVAAGAPVAGWLLLDPRGEVLGGSAPFFIAPVPSDEPPSALRARLQTIAKMARADTPLHAVVEEERFVGIVSVLRLADGRTLVYGLDEERVKRALETAAEAQNDELQAVLRIESQSDAPVPDALERLNEMLRDPATVNPAGPEEVLSRRLDPPFERFTLAVIAPPVQIGGVVVVYIVLLVLFLGTLITGVVVTARLIWLETRLSRLKTDFVSHVSHELRTPLTSIRMFIETLRLGRATSAAEQQECLDLLSKETERLSEMIERVLGYARLRAGRRQFTPRPVSVEELLGDALDAFRAHTLHKKGDASLQMKVEIEPDLPLVNGDREALVEGLLNLVGNAYKYTGAEKQITVFGRLGRRGRVLLGVKDNGPGLPKSEHAQVFDRFYQANHLLSGKSSGSGLGLAITKAIVDGHGGRVFVESEPGRGATFVVDLPPLEDKS